jgi:hypothetical protein
MKIVFTNNSATSDLQRIWYRSCTRPEEQMLGDGRTVKSWIKG